MDNITLQHGAGGDASRRLVEDVIAPELGASYLGEMEDSACLSLMTGRIAMTTDSFVIDPIFFGNGDVGKLAVCGTVNDLAVSGAIPVYLTLGLVLEEGFPIEDLRRILRSVRDAAAEANVHIVAGDTKVVGMGAVDKIFINTAGIGYFPTDREPLTVRRVEENDAIILTSPIGGHSIHILSMREGLGFETRVVSDCAPLNEMLGRALETAPKGMHAARDITRGGLGTALNELATMSGFEFTIDLDSVPRQHEATMAADMLGVDLMYLANEGCCVIFAASDSVPDIMAALRADPHGRSAALIGQVVRGQSGRVIGVSEGEHTVVEPLVDAQLPRLC